MNFSFTMSDKEYYSPVQLYLRQIKEIRKQYTNKKFDDIEELFRKIKEGDEQAKEIIFYRFLHIVPRTVRLYVKDNIHIEDLIQEGNIALLEAIDSYDYFRYGYSFPTYVKWQIKKRIYLTISFYITPFKIPVNSVASLRQLNKYYEQHLSQEETTNTSIMEVAKKMNPGNSLVKLIYAVKSFSLDELDINQIHSIEENFSFEDQVLINTLFQKIAIHFNTLTERERDVVCLIFGLGHDRTRTLEEIGKILGFQRERIRHILGKALRKLKKLSKEDNVF